MERPGGDWFPASFPFSDAWRDQLSVAFGGEGWAGGVGAHVCRPLTVIPAKAGIQAAGWCCLGTELGPGTATTMSWGDDTMGGAVVYLASSPWQRNGRGTEGV
jgi:hypothetical protein